MTHGSLLTQLVATSFVAVIALWVAGRLRIPAIVALIATGVAVGPSALGVVPTREDVDLLAEIGVVLLMFTVGLEFSFVHLRPMLRVTLVGGGLQLAFTTLAVVGVVLAPLGDTRLALLAGLFVALTSTAILLKELASRNAVGSPQGRLVVAVSLLQDLTSILMLALLPVLAGRMAGPSLIWTLLRTILALAGVAVFGSFLLPRLMRAVTPDRNREAFSLAVVLASLGTAWFTSQLGVSMALGAFLAGLVLAESEFTQQIHAEVRPLRDILTSVFFVSIGMIIDLPTLVPLLPLVLLCAIALIVVKTVTSAGALLAVRVPLRQAATAGLLLVPVGEFSFVLGRGALDAKLLTPELWQLLLGTSVTTMMLAPWIIVLILKSL